MPASRILVAVSVAVALLEQVPHSSAFSSSVLPSLRRSHVARAGSWRCNVQSAEQYKIVPSQLAESGGGWTIMGVKAPPKAGTVWARPRPNVGEVQKMGVGSYGTIYLGTDLKTGEEVAVKTEKDLGQKNSPLRSEAETLIELQGSHGVPDVFWLGKRELAGEDMNILVMELLGPDLEDLLEMLDTRQLSVKSTLMLGYQMIDALADIHEKGILHRDIKPENFLMGVKNHANNVYLIDFGMSAYYVDEDSNHLPERKGPDSLRGTLRYASTWKHDGVEQSRRDDVQELVFVLVYLMRPGLPWQEFEAKTFDGMESNKFQRTRQLNNVANMKRTIAPEKLCAGLPPQIAELHAYSKGLGFFDEPDYEWMKGKIQEAMDAAGYEWDFQYDWGSRVQVPKKRFGLF
mmetsp:Transcript_39688/g.94050  ORF Transcript_39688/g.94050 Transcript_39688/m.94050 type:complete len:403 (-) Transcript_39688:225-1433(-)